MASLIFTKKIAGKHKRERTFDRMLRHLLMKIKSQFLIYSPL